MSDARSGAGNPAPTRRGDAARRASVRFSTRRRLIAAFSAVLLAVMAAFALQLVGLRKMEVTFAEMKGHEEQMHLALELEDATRDQYGHETRYLMGEADGLAEYEAARARAERTLQTLRLSVDEPEAIAWLDEVRDAGVQLDALFRAHVASGSRGPEARTATLEKSYGRLLLIEGNVDNVFRLLQRTNSEVRGALVALERRATRWTAVLLVLTPLFIAGAVLYLSRSVAQPLARLSEGAAALAAGDLDTRIEIATPDEFGALASELNSMTVALKHHQQRLVESEKLAGIGRLAAGVAHELNNPLQVIIGYLSLDRDVPDRRLALHLAAIEEEALRCKGIVDGLLELSRPSTSVRTSPVDLRSLCEDVVDRLRVSGLPGAPCVTIVGEGFALGDAAKLRQVVFNLVKNAVEAAGPSGEVDVQVKAAPRGVEVIVRDSGPGIAPETKVRLFEPFFTTKQTGTGLGLTVSRAIAIAHGGDIDIGSAESGGAIFTLRLPGAERRN